MTKYFSKSTRFYYGGYNPGTATTHVAAGIGVSALDPTSIGDAGERTLSGPRIDSFEWAGLFDDGTSFDFASTAYLGGIGTNRIVSMLIGTSVGDRAKSAAILQVSVTNPVTISELVRQEADFVVDGHLRQAIHYGVAQSYTATGSGAGVDNGASSTAGGTGFLHVFEVTSGTLHPLLEHSADDITYVTAIDFGTFTTGTGADARVMTGSLNPTGSVRRYTRLRNSGTGTGNFVITFHRNANI